MDKSCHSLKEDNNHHLGYDDVNESLASKENVSSGCENSAWIGRWHR